MPPPNSRIALKVLKDYGIDGSTFFDGLQARLLQDFIGDHNRQISHTLSPLCNTGPVYMSTRNKVPGTPRLKWYKSGHNLSTRSQERGLEWLGGARTEAV